MKWNWNLRAFFVVVVILGIATCLSWDYVLPNHVNVKPVVLGPLTTGADSSSAPLTIDELQWAITRQKVDATPGNAISVIRTARIEEFENSVDRPREIPLIGFAELHKTIFRCDVEALSTDGTFVKRTLFVEKNHFHLVDID